MIDGVNMSQNTKKHLQLTSPIPPSVNHYLAYRVIKKGNKYIAQSYVTKEAKQYKEKFIPYVQMEAKKQNWQYIDYFKQIIVECTFYFPRIDMDTNNYFKVMFDAITDSKSVWMDDNLACERVVRIQYDADNPRIELNIYESDFIGIFDSENDYINFLQRCKNCRRYTRNCSILNKSINGKIVHEVTEKYCKKFKEKR